MIPGRWWKETHGRGRGGQEDQTTEVRCALVRQGAGGVDEGADGVALGQAADEGGAEGDAGAGGLLALDELLARLRVLGPAVGLAEDGGENGGLNGLVEDEALVGSVSEMISYAGVGGNWGNFQNLRVPQPRA